MGVFDASFRYSGGFRNPRPRASPRNDQRLPVPFFTYAYGWLSPKVVNKTIRDGARGKAGDIVIVQMERDVAERAVEVPLPLRKALAKSQAAGANWARLSYTHQKEIARSITDAKKEETRARRLEKVIAILKAGKKWTG